MTSRDFLYYQSLEQYKVCYYYLFKGTFIVEYCVLNLYIDEDSSRSCTDANEKPSNGLEPGVKTYRF